MNSEIFRGRHSSAERDRRARLKPRPTLIQIATASALPSVSQGKSPRSGKGVGGEPIKLTVVVLVIQVVLFE